MRKRTPICTGEGDALARSSERAAKVGLSPRPARRADRRRSIPAAFVQGLEAQRAYVRAQRGVRHGLVVAPAFLRGVRRSGYLSTASALNELIDNAIEAGSRSIHVVFGFGQSQSKPDAIAVLDDGHGMDVGMLRLALAWGGTHREDGRNGFGRFGYGLPTASLSQGRTVSVYSRPPRQPFSCARLALGSLGGHVESRQRPPSIVTRRKKLPAWLAEYATKFVPTLVEPDGHGTVVLLEDLDAISWRTAIALERNLEQAIGVTYRNFFRRIRFCIQGRRIKPIDPLFLMPRAQFTDLDQERAVKIVCGPISVEIGDGRVATIPVRAAYFPPTFGRIDKAREASGRNANARFSIMKEHPGLIVCRLGRQLDTVTTGLWTQFKNNDRYWAIELDIPPILDDAIALATNKQKVVFSEALRDALRKSELPKLVEQLRRRYLRDRKTVPMAVLLDPVSLNGHRGTRNGSDGPFYELNGSKLGFTLNDQHAFFRKVYAQLDGPAARLAIDALLGAIADSERHSAVDVRRFYERERLAWSRRLDASLDDGSAADVEITV